MGSTSSQLVDAEKKSWGLPHKLNQDPVLADSQKALLPNFSDTLYLCSQAHSLWGIQYEHWFITDGNWTIEFGGRDELERNTVIVHKEPKNGNLYSIRKQFSKTTEIMERMKQVCGTTNYSLALRNCEHVARYIQSGVWISFQMGGTGTLKKIFFDDMKTHTKLVNTFPMELEPEKTPGEVLYPEHNNKTYLSIKFLMQKDALTEDERKHYNVILLGPTGSGKSTLINHLFNKEVVKADATATSVTKQLQFIQGLYSGADVRTVNIIDTIGFCDSVFTARQVLSMIKSSVRVNLAEIDRVIIVCSGRIEANHAEAIKQFMEWLQYTKYKNNFAFIFNKSDGLSPATKTKNLFTMCEMLQADPSLTIQYNIPGTHNISTEDLVQALGFPSQVEYEKVSKDMESLVHMTLSQDFRRQRQRIPVSENSCTIL